MRPLKLGIALLVVGGAACHPRSSSLATSGWCTEQKPPIGPAGHVEVNRSSLRDTLVADPKVGQLIAFLRWSSDSLASESGPPALLYLRTPGAPSDSPTSIRGVAQVQRKVSTVALSAPENTYRLEVRVLGGVRLDTLVAVRGGYTDTLAVLVQASGQQICS